MITKVMIIIKNGEVNMPKKTKFNMLIGLQIKVQCSLIGNSYIRRTNANLPPYMGYP
jgi:hypothetical protein